MKDEPQVEVIRIVRYKGTADAVRKAIQLSRTEGDHHCTGYIMTVATYSSNLPPAIDVDASEVADALSDLPPSLSLYEQRVGRVKRTPRFAEVVKQNATVEGFSLPSHIKQPATVQEMAEIMKKWGPPEQPSDIAVPVSPFEEKGCVYSPSHHPTYITTSSGLRGMYPVMMVWTGDDGTGFYEPFNTGETCKSFDECVAAAKEWAESEGVEYR